MRYDLIEDEFKTRLAVLSPDVNVVLLADNQADFKKTPSKSTVTIAYVGSKFNPYDETKPDFMTFGVVSQKETLLIQIHIQAKKKRGEGGIHAISEAVRLLLFGFQPTDCEKTYIFEQRMAPEPLEDGVWQYVYTYATKSTIVEDGDVNKLETGAILNEEGNPSLLTKVSLLVGTPGETVE